MADSIYFRYILTITMQTVVIVIITLALSGVFDGLQRLSLGYILEEIPFWCVTVPPNNSFPAVNRSHVSSCEVVVLLGDNLSTIPCDTWDYDKSHLTAVAEYNLVCGQRFWIFLSQTIFLLGDFVGTLVSGAVADTWGRKPTIITATLLSAIFNSAAAFSPSIVVLNFLRFFAAASSISLYYVGFTYSLEIVAEHWKAAVTVLFGTTVSIGMALAPVLNIYFPHWRHLQLVSSVPILIMILPLCCPYFLAESTRWLDANNGSKHQDSDKPLSSTEKTSLLKSLNSAICEVSSFKFLFTSPGICFSTIILLYIWCVFLVIYNFVLMNAKNIIPGNEDLNIEIMSGLDVMACFASFPLIHYRNRRISASTCFMITGASFLCSFHISYHLTQQSSHK